VLLSHARGVDVHQDEDEFEGGLLHATYADINGDGHFDIVLSGIVILRGENSDREVAKKECKRVFLWNKTSGMFQETKKGSINPQLCSDK